MSRQDDFRAAVLQSPEDDDHGHLLRWAGGYHPGFQ